MCYGKWTAQEYEIFMTDSLNKCGWTSEYTDHT